MSENTVNAGLRRLGFTGDEMTGHGFRAMARTILDEVLGYRVEWIEHQLAHEVRDHNGRAYNRTAFLQQRKEMMQGWADYLDGLRKNGSSIGAVIEVVADGVPAGLGAPIYGKLDGDLAAALMGINAVKGVEIGAGFKSVEQRGSEHRDEMTPQGFKSNHAGGVLGGISSGQEIVVSLALKPTSSIALPGSTIDIHGAAVDIATTGRHDPCVGFRATPIAEAMLALVLMDHYLRYRAQCADVVSVTPVITHR